MYFENIKANLTDKEKQTLEKLIKLFIGLDALDTVINDFNSSYNILTRATNDIRANKIMEELLLNLFHEAKTENKEKEFKQRIYNEANEKFESIFKDLPKRVEEYYNKGKADIEEVFNE